MQQSHDPHMVSNSFPEHSAFSDPKHISVKHIFRKSHLSLWQAPFPRYIIVKPRVCAKVCTGFGCYGERSYLGTWLSAARHDVARHGMARSAARGRVARGVRHAAIAIIVTIIVINGSLVIIVTLMLCYVILHYIMLSYDYYSIADETRRRLDMGQLMPAAKSRSGKRARPGSRAEALFIHSFSYIYIYIYIYII